MDAKLVYTYTADGLRVAQSVDGDVTTFAWDWASGIPEMLAQSPNPQSPNPPSLYLVGHDTMGRFADGEWAYHLPDALGSVRQVVDGAGSLASSREWTPFGVEVGVPQAGLGYTGEYWDTDVGLQYLRACWYAPETGRFTQRDSWNGSVWRPQTLLRGFTYSYNSPLNLFDPLGTKPQRGWIYSCNCGFIDPAHFDQSEESTAAEIIQDVRNTGAESTFEIELPNAYWVPGIKRWVGQITKREVLIKQDLTPEEELEVALGIFQAFENASEEGWAQSIRSKYSEEDLISNLLSFYLAVGGEYTQANIEKWCGFLPEKQSVEIYDWYVEHLKFKPVKEWTNPRLAVCSDAKWRCGLWGALGLIECPVCPLDKHCPPEKREFPTDKLNITPESEGQKWEFIDPRNPGILFRKKLFE